MDATFYRFGPFRLYPSEQLLLREQEVVALPPKAFEVLLALVASEGHLMTRDALMRLVWPRGFVEEINLTVNISLLRKLLGRLPDGSAYIVTIPRRGYRFRAPVTHEASEPGSAILLPASGIDAAFDAPAALDAPRPTQDFVATPPRPPLLIRSPRRPRIMATRLAAMVALAAIALAGAWWSATQRTRDVAPVTLELAIRTLAVLPFELISDDAPEQALGLGLADALITRLGGQDKLRIRSLGAVRRYAGTGDPLAAGRELEVDAVLDGTIQHLAGQTRVSVRLIQVDSGAILWTDTFDAPGGTPFVLEDSISQSLAVALSLELDEAKPPSSPGIDVPQRDVHEAEQQP